MNPLVSLFGVVSKRAFEWRWFIAEETMLRFVMWKLSVWN